MRHAIQQGILVIVLCVLSVVGVAAAEHHGRVLFGGLPVPGATVTAEHGGKKIAAVTDEQGAYSFPDLADGPWTIEVEMLCFAPIRQDVTVAPSAPAAQWELKLLPLGQINAETKAPSPASPPPPAPAPQTGARAADLKRNPGVRAADPKRDPGAGANNFQRTDVNATASNGAATPAAPEKQSGAFADQSPEELAERASDGFLINGSTNNSASSPFALFPAFGNMRKGPRSLYNGSLGLILGNSALDARSFSLTGQDTPKPGYSHVTGLASFGGPLRIPHLVKNGPNITVNYQWTRNRNAITQPGLMPTLAQRNGEGLVPPDRISPQARALLSLYPLPNFTGSSRYNYQVPIVSNMHQDSLQSRFNKTIGRRNQIAGSFAYQSTRSDNPNLFEFLDTSNSTGINTGINWRHNFTQRMFGNLGYQYSRLAARTTPYFANRRNVSGEAGITGNNQEPVNWGPPALVFAGGMTSLSDALPAFTRNQTSALSYSMLWNHDRHNFTFGGDYRRLQFNTLSQQDPRGTFTFTGAAGSDFADFLLGVPDTSSIAFGNADKYFRDASYDAYFTDDWRMSPGFTLNAGARWEYTSPITELYGRLVNLDIATGFAAVAPVVALSPAGTLTGQKYPDSLVRPDKHGIQPRVGFSWRPFLASSLIVRGGYGVYYNTSTYQSIASSMAQQAPLSRSLSVQDTAASPLTLADGFKGSPLTTSNTFAIDPGFRIGYAQNWNLSVQRDLPAALVMTATYLGTKGTRGMQQFLPNTFPLGAVNPCPACPAGFVYLASNGNSTRHSGQVQLRRRLHNGLTATLQYTFAKAIDDSALGGKNQGGVVIAQNWLDLAAERGLSNFDQRHLLNFQLQYTTGMGMHGGALLNGWRGTLFKEWTAATQITAGSGLPLTPVYLAAVKGTGVTGSIRPDYTGAPLYDAPSGLSLNPLAYTPPASGHWGNAGRNSITGPSQFSLNASLARTFRLSDRVSMDLRVDAFNALNHVTFPSWNTAITNAQFGLPTAANAMRSVQTVLRARF